MTETANDGIDFELDDALTLLDELARLRARNVAELRDRAFGPSSRRSPAPTPSSVR